MINRIDLQGFDIGDKTAAVIGAGGLGCHIATHLACAGVGRLIICDHDSVSESNLNRQFLYTYADIGKPKATLAARRINAVSPDTDVTAVSAKIEKPDDLSFAESADIVFSAVDNNAARLALQEFCRGREKPLVNGGVNGFFGTVYLWLPGETPDLSAAGMLEAENGSTLSISSTVGIIASVEAQLGIQFLIGRKDCAGLLHVLSGTEIQIIKIR